MNKIYVIKNKVNQLEASDIHSEEMMDKLNEGVIYGIKPTKPRNPQHHKKWRALVNIVFDNQDKYDTKKHLITEIKLRAGHYEDHLTLRGVIIYVPKSLSFDECDQVEFDEFYDKAVNVCLKYFVSMDKQELIDRVSRF